MTFVELIISVIAIAAIIVLLASFLSRKTVPDISSDDDVLNLLRQGDRLSAIKAYRQLHGVSLKEAKIFVEKYSINLEK